MLKVTASTDVKWHFVPRFFIGVMMERLGMWPRDKVVDFIKRAVEIKLTHEEVK